MQTNHDASLACDADANHGSPETADTQLSAAPRVLSANVSTPSSASLPLFADTFCASADFSAIAALIEEEEDEQRIREQAARDEAKLRRRVQRMEVDGEAEVNRSSAAPASTTRLHRSQRRQAADPYSNRAKTRTQQSSRGKKASKPTPIRPMAAHTPSQPISKSGQADTLTAAETALFMQMWHIGQQAD